MSLVQGRDYIMTARLGVGTDGKIVGLDIKVVACAGAYPAIGAILPMLTQMMAVGVYAIPKVRSNAVMALTNNTTIGAYRGAGRPEATQLIERVLDVAARRDRHGPGRDPAGQLPPARELPAHHAHRAPTTTSGEYEKALDAALQASSYSELRAEQARRRSSGDSKQLGIGVSSYVEVTAPVGLHVEFGAVEVHDDGTASVFAGTSVHGQGHQTAFAMLASDVLGIPMDKITLVNSDTDRVPRGAGTMGSRSLQTAGSAIHVASNEVFARAQKIAAHLLEAVSRRHRRGRRWPARRRCPGERALVGRSRGGLHVMRRVCRAASSPRPLRHELDFDGTDSTYPFGSHVSVVEVDTETGEVTMLRHVAVDDCGRILNPLLVNGQQHGGIAQGAAQALFEWMQYDEDGNPLTSTLADYAMPSAAELLQLRGVEHPDRQPAQPARGQGHRRVGHDRLDARHPERGRRRRVAISA